jgi:hypothetical protein
MNSVRWTSNLEALRVLIGEYIAKPPFKNTEKKGYISKREREREREKKRAYRANMR